MSEHPGESGSLLFDWVAAHWLAMLGVWPLADPGHDLSRGSLLVSLDLLLHAAGFVWLVRLHLRRFRSQRAAHTPAPGAPDE